MGLGKPPPAGYLKCNLDAAMFIEQNRIGAAACNNRNEAGQFILAYTVGCNASMAAAEAEAWGLIQALNWLYSTNIPGVIIEMGSK